MRACNPDAPPKLKKFILSQMQKASVQDQSPSNKNGPPFKKSKWTPEEDQLLIDSVNKNGMGNWSLVCLTVPGRSGKQCRERWINQLCPELNKHSWDPQEDAILIQQHNVYGNFWTKIAQFLPGRSANNIKNRWSWLSRHLVQQNLFPPNVPMLLLPNSDNIQINKIQPNPQILYVQSNPIIQSSSPIYQKSLPLPFVHYPIQNFSQQPDLGQEFPIVPPIKAMQKNTSSDTLQTSLNLSNSALFQHKQKLYTEPDLEIKINPPKYIEVEKT